MTSQKVDNPLLQWWQKAITAAPQLPQLLSVIAAKDCLPSSYPTTWITVDEGWLV